MLRPTSLFIALRYLRSKRESRFGSFVSLVSVIGIALGVAVLIIISSVMNGFEREVTRHILGVTGHAILFRPAEPMSDWQAKMAILSKQNNVTAVAPFIRSGAMLSHRGEVRGVSLQGIDLSLETEVSSIGDYLNRTKSSNHNNKDTIILGHELARNLSAGIDQQVMIIAPRFSDSGGMRAPKYFQLTVVDHFDVGMHEFDANLALVPISVAQKVFGYGDDITGLRIKLNDADIAPTASRQLAGLLDPPTAAIDWTQYHRNFFLAIKSQKRIMFIILSIIVAVAAFNIVGSMIMLVREKMKDIAILRTIGLTRRAVMTIFIIQGSLVGVIGVAIGIVIGMLGAHYAGNVVTWLEQQLAIEFIKPDVYYIDYLPTAVQAPDIVLIASTATILSIFATILPAWQAAKTNPAEVLRYE